MISIKQLMGGVSRLLPGATHTDDPLHDPHRLTQWLAALPQGDALATQQQILRLLRSHNDDPHEFSAGRLAAFRLLDEQAQPRLSLLGEQYLRNPRMSQVVENTLWQTLYNTYWELARGYQAQVTQLRFLPAQQQHSQDLPTVLVRGLRQVRQQLKWRYLRYQLAQPGTWASLHGLYRAAEQAGCTHHPCQAYPGETQTVTCEREYLHALMLDRAHPSAFYPRQIDLVDQCLLRWCSHLHLEPPVSPGTFGAPVFVVDTGRDQGAFCPRGTPGAPASGSWSTVPLIAELDHITGQIQAGTPAEATALARALRQSESLELLAHLHRQWAPLATRDLRRHPRARCETKLPMEVCHGLSSLINCIKSGQDGGRSASLYGDTLRLQEKDDLHVYGFVTERTRQNTVPASAHGPGNVEMWVMEDCSECGYGATVLSEQADWLRPGALVGLRCAQNPEWQAGIVRRLQHRSNTETSVGIETLAGTPRLALLYPQPGGAARDAQPTSLPLAALLFETADRLTLLLDPARYQPGLIVQLRTGNAPVNLRLGSALEHAEGWLRVCAERFDHAG